MHSSNPFETGPWTIDLAPGEISREIQCDGIIDLNGLGELVGVEILDFRRQTGAMTPQSGGNALPKCGYDAEIDAFYVRITKGSSPIQKKAKGTVALDAENHMLGVTVALVDP